LMGVGGQRQGDEVFMLTNLRDDSRPGQKAVQVDFRVAASKSVDATLPETMTKLDQLCIKYNKKCMMKLGVKYRGAAGEQAVMKTGTEGVESDEEFKVRFSYELGRLLKAEEATVKEVVQNVVPVEDGDFVNVSFEIHKSPTYGSPGVMSVEASCELINDRVLAGEGTIFNDTDTYRWLSQLDKPYHVEQKTLVCEMSRAFDHYKWLKRVDTSFEPPTVYGDPDADSQPTPEYADVQLAFKLKQSQIRPDGDNERDFKRSFLMEVSSALGVSQDTLEIQRIVRMKATDDEDSDSFDGSVCQISAEEATKDALTPPSIERVVVAFRITEACTLLGPKVPESMYKLRRLVKDTRSSLYRVSERRDTDACSKLDPAIKPDIKVWRMNKAEAAAFKTVVHSDNDVTLMRFFRCFTMLYGEIRDEEFSVKMGEFKVGANQIVEQRRIAAAEEAARGRF